MELLCVAVDPYLPEGNTHFFRPSDKFYFELDLWETDFEDRLETYIKISDLRFAIEHGFNLTKHVMEYIDNMPKEPGYLEPILAAFRRYIKFLRTGIGLLVSPTGMSILTLCSQKIYNSLNLSTLSLRI